LRERDSRAKLYQKEYADGTRGAKHSNIEEGDKGLLKQTRENKLSPNYEPEAYTATRKDGNAAILQDANGNNKMRNIAHMKKFVDPETVDMQRGNRSAATPSREVSAARTGSPKSQC